VELADLIDTRKGETAWVFGSGATLNFIDPAFFEGKLIISTNFSAITFGLTPQFMFTNHHSGADEVAGKLPNIIFVVNRYETPEPKEYVGTMGNVVVNDAKHIHNSFGAFDPYGRDKPDRPDQLVIGSTSTHGAMHLAALLGAVDIVLVGVDCGVLDAGVNVSDYPQQTQQSFTVWNDHLILMRNWLRDTYGARVYSLNPFVNLHLEGHTFGWN
jgi:hypothetical protein